MILTQSPVPAGDADQSAAMATIEIARVPQTQSPAELWHGVARLTRDWLAARTVLPRDAVLLLPYSALLPAARAAFAAAGGWQPRIETASTLAASLRPPPALQPGRVSGDPVLDRLTATALLSAQGWAQAWLRRDRRGFEHLVAQVVESAQTLARAAGQRPPGAREAFWDTVRQASVAAGGPGAIESLLLQVALEWAALGRREPTDVLFDQAVGAWIGVRIGGGDPLVDHLLAAHPAPALLIDADPPLDEPFPPLGRQHAERWVCDDLESEAQAAASLVLQSLEQGRGPVALIASDRVLVRRVRALLERRRVTLSDETGWRLSTTPVAARVMALLRAAAPDAPADARLDWIKSLRLGPDDQSWIRTLESMWREARRLPQGARDAAEQRWQDLSALLAPLSAGRTRALTDWLASLDLTLARSAALAFDAQADEAEAAVVRALRLGVADEAWKTAARPVVLDLSGFTAWVDSVLDATNHEPSPMSGADVVLTPMARAVGRDFAHVVLPAADDQHLGAVSSTPTLISESLAQRLDLDRAGVRQQRQLLAFAQLLRVPRLSLLRRRVHDGQPVGSSVFVQWLAACRQTAGAASWPEQAWRPPLRTVASRPQRRPRPAAPAALPTSLSASTVEALRQCPYRFFARAVLKLEELVELDAPLAKRDYGNWLHLTLHRFHEQRHAGHVLPDSDQLAQSAAWATAELKLDAASLLPYQASFEVFAPRYLEWLAGRESEGWSWAAGEEDHSARPELLQPQQLRGRVDRIDRGPGGGVAVLDYKTGDLGMLQAKVRDPLEDTQLAFYAALLLGSTEGSGPIQAMYLALDCADAPKAVVHQDVEATATLMLAGLADDFVALRAGAAMPALGEGRVCDSCEARGLCRRDHWPAPATVPDLRADAREGVE